MYDLPPIRKSELRKNVRTPPRHRGGSYDRLRYNIQLTKKRKRKRKRPRSIQRFSKKVKNVKNVKNVRTSCCQALRREANSLKGAPNPLPRSLRLIKWEPLRVPRGEARDLVIATDLPPKPGRPAPHAKTRLWCRAPSLKARKLPDTPACNYRIAHRPPTHGFPTVRAATC